MPPASIAYFPGLSPHALLAARAVTWAHLLGCIISSWQWSFWELLAKKMTFVEKPSKKHDSENKMLKVQHVLRAALQKWQVVTGLNPEIAEYSKNECPVWVPPSLSVFQWCWPQCLKIGSTSGSKLVLVSGMLGLSADFKIRSLYSFKNQAPVPMFWPIMNR